MGGCRLKPLDLPCYVVLSMPEEKPLTKSSLMAALKEAGVATRDAVREIVGREISAREIATKDDVREIVGQGLSSGELATKDDLYEVLAEFHRGEVQPELAKIRASIEEVRVSLSWVKDEVNGLKAELSDTPSRKEFENLKREVAHYHAF